MLLLKKSVQNQEKKNKITNKLKIGVALGGGGARGLTHIGIIIDRLSLDGKRNLIVHNIGGGQVAEDILFDYQIIGHYRFK